MRFNFTRGNISVTVLNLHINGSHCTILIKKTSNALFLILWILFITNIVNLSQQSLQMQVYYKQNYNQSICIKNINYDKNISLELGIKKYFDPGISGRQV